MVAFLVMGNLRVPPNAPLPGENRRPSTQDFPYEFGIADLIKISGRAAVSITRKGKVELKRPEEKLNDAGIWQFRLKGNGLKIWDPIARMNRVLGFFTDCTMVNHHPTSI